MGFLTLFTAGKLLVKGIDAISKNQKKKAADRTLRANRKQLADFEENRQKVVNPYEGYENLSSLMENNSALAQDLGSMVTNPYENLSVATQAAEFQAEEADIALANTLDTLRASGASAGGATALAQAALRSKKGISASIEAQESKNELLKAQGEERVNNLQIAEKQRIQNIEMSEAQRLQGVELSEGQRIQESEALGKDYVFQEQEKRDLVKLERLQAKVDGSIENVENAIKSRNNSVSGFVESAMAPDALGQVAPFLKKTRIF
jgi:hypothetical protein